MPCLSMFNSKQGFPPRFHLIYSVPSCARMGEKVTPFGRSFPMLFSGRVKKSEYVVTLHTTRFSILQVLYKTASFPTENA